MTVFSQDPIQSQVDPVHLFRLYFAKNHSNITIHLHIRLLGTLVV
jgi:hypothetical protein